MPFQYDPLMLRRTIREVIEKDPHHRSVFYLEKLKQNGFSKISRSTIERHLNAMADLRQVKFSEMELGETFKKITVWDINYE